MVKHFGEGWRSDDRLAFFVDILDPKKSRIETEEGAAALREELIDDPNGGNHLEEPVCEFATESCELIV